ncbi:MAG TPA: hypothetical protein VGU45_16325 [Microvirga sp.]|jgi:hypothetical protein|nr:hypothetical protein [Microvirga sp.]
MIRRDIAVLICSRGRKEVLARLLADLQGGFLPALGEGGLTASVLVYAQGYSAADMTDLERAFAGAVARQDLVLMTAERPHDRIGDVVRSAVERMRETTTCRLAMLMDDDSTYDADPLVDANLRDAARAFIAQGHRAYSIKLGSGRELAYGPFLNPDDPIMPFKEKMMWVSPAVLDAVLGLPRFSELSIGEDAVIAALAWLADPQACLAVHGLATFLHLGFEQASGEDVPGGYADLMKYDPRSGAEHGKYDAALRTGVTPFHVMPDVFVPEDHPRFIFNGVRKSLVDKLLR